MTERKYNAGMTLIELMVAMAIGMFLLIGAVSVFMGGRTTFRLTESVARLQENGRFALDVLESDIRMAHYFGLTTRAYNVANRRKTTLSNSLGSPTTCGNNWILDLDNSIAAANNGLPVAQGAWLISCPPSLSIAGMVRQPNTDTIVVRRASEDVANAAAGSGQTWYIQSGRYAVPQSMIFQGTALPASLPAATSETHRLIADGYYIGDTSSISIAGNRIPSLRARMLQTSNGQITDNEIMPGVQDMQIQFGLDTDLPATAERGSIDRYVNPDDPIIDPTNVAFNKDAEILAVRIWLLLRGENIENGLGNQTFTYAGTTTTYTDSFRRVLVSKTIYLRNARTVS